jgi:hypothetical protein
MSSTNDDFPHAATPTQPQSALVQMHLLFGGMTLSISQLGPDFLMLRDQITMPPGAGEVYLQVNASERHWPVQLPEGIDAAKGKTAIQNLG